MQENVQSELTLEQLRALPTFEMDFYTPEGAILCLRDAYRRKHIESACACKNFLIEGILALMEMDPDLVRSADFRKHKALDLERRFRKETTEAWPDLKGVETFFIDHQRYINGVVVITMLYRMPDGSFNKQNLLVANTLSGWRVLNEVDDSEIQGEVD